MAMIKCVSAQDAPVARACASACALLAACCVRTACCFAACVRACMSALTWRCPQAVAEGVVRLYILEVSLRRVRGVCLSQSVLCARCPGQTWTGGEIEVELASAARPSPPLRPSPPSHDAAPCCAPSARARTRRNTQDGRLDRETLISKLLQLDDAPSQPGVCVETVGSDKRATLCEGDGHQ